MNASGVSVRVRKQFHARGLPAFSLDVVLEFPPGFTILFGPSGAGKSTLLDCIAGLTQPDAGRIAAGEEAFFDAERKINLVPRLRRVAYVFQSLALFPHLTVEENAGYGLAEMAPAERREAVRAILESFRIGGLAGRKPGEISGGERQRVALARALVTSPRVLLLDEPLSALDDDVKNAIVEDLRAWSAERLLPVVYVTHSRGEAEALGERLIALDAGRAVAEGPLREALAAFAARVRA